MRQGELAHSPVRGWDRKSEPALQLREWEWAHSPVRVVRVISSQRVRAKVGPLSSQRMRAYLEESVMVHHPVLAVQQRQQGVLRVEQHLALPLLLVLPGRVAALLQGQDLWGTGGNGSELFLNLKTHLCRPGILRVSFREIVWCHYDTIRILLNWGGSDSRVFKAENEKNRICEDKCRDGEKTQFFLFWAVVLVVVAEPSLYLLPAPQWWGRRFWPSGGLTFSW